jgi:hypothetical protein
MQLVHISGDMRLMGFGRSGGAGRMSVLMLLACASCGSSEEPTASCQGLPAACANYLSSESCDRTPGCQSSAGCRPIAELEPCVGKSQNACELDNECVWRPELGAHGQCRLAQAMCYGYATESDCDSWPEECEWELYCTGSPPQCESVEEESDCNAILGCSWETGS